ncbi:MAG: NUDIX domain-containing protein [Patescibacteria group bacterium]
MAQRVFTQSFAVVGAIIEKNGSILLVKEGWESHDKGKWNQPAGWIDPGTEPLQAIKNEVKEETGYIFEPKALLGIYSLVKPERAGQVEGLPHAIKLIFLGDISGNASADGKEITEVKWFRPEEIFSMSGSVLRDMDIKQEVKDYFAGRAYPLEIIRHTINS